MKLTIDLEETWAVEESIADCMKEVIKYEIEKEIRKIVRATVEENKTAISAVASAYAKNAIAKARKTLESME